MFGRAEVDQRVNIVFEVIRCISWVGLLNDKHLEADQICFQNGQNFGLPSCLVHV